MFRAISLLVFLALSANAQQDCVPNHVGKVTLDLNFTLYWEPSTNCESTSYAIYIRVEDALQYYYSTQAIYLDVSFLPACERFHFEVRAYSGSSLSDEVTLETYVPALSGTDLTITYFNASVQDGVTFLQWEVTPHYAHCARAFRVVVRDGDNLPRDIYTDRNHLFISNLIPCGQYEFAVMAIYNLLEEGPVALVNYQVPGQIASPPLLESVDVGNTYVTIGWSLPPYSENRCTVRSLIVDALPFLHQVFPVYDSAERPLYTMNLTNLESDSMYILKVTTVNSAGTSEPYQVGVQTAPALTV